MHDDAEALAREVLSAYETGQMIDVPLSARPGFDLNMAYDVEAILQQFRETAGHKAVGRKVGYANKAMWRVLKLETLVWAHMYDDTVHYNDSNSATLAISHPRSLKVKRRTLLRARTRRRVSFQLCFLIRLSRREHLART